MEIIINKGHLHEALVLLPTASGRIRPLDYGYDYISSQAVEIGLSVYQLEFSGQNGVNGSYSVYRSSQSFVKFCNSNPQINLHVFGICAGALAALYAANYCKNIKSIFCWDMRSNYSYTKGEYLKLEKKHGVVVDWRTAYIELQPVKMLDAITIPIKFSCGTRSKCTNLYTQQEMASTKEQFTASAIAGVGHVPGLPRGSEILMTAELLNWLEEVTGRA